MQLTGQGGHMDSWSWEGDLSIALREAGALYTACI